LNIPTCAKEIPMSTLADRTIAALRVNYDDLSARVRTFSDDDLDRQSGATEWDVAQVLSHMGSAAEIGLAALEQGQAGAPAPGPEFNQQVWDRWNAMSQREKAEGYLTWAEALVVAYEGLDADSRATLTVQLSFLPFPADVALLSGMRLNEVALHSWDVRVAFDPDATLGDEEAGVLLEQLRGPLGFLVGFTARTAVLDGREVNVNVRAADQDEHFGLVLGESAAVADASGDPHAEIVADADAILRLISGRLREQHTPGSVVVTGDVTLDQLRQVFPGF
jgi:uncharacterized protein (TIGR03083 family)